MLRVCLAATLLLWMTAAGAAPRPYELQQDESRVGFSWFLGRDEIKGRMPVKSADIAIDFDRVENSRVRVTLDVAKAQAGFPFASQGMKSPSVLWAAKYPEIRFTSTRFERDGPGAKVTGDLTVRGVTRPVVLDARLFRPIGTKPGDRRRVSILLEGSLSRRDFGADGWADLAGDEVKLSILAHIHARD